MEDTIKIPAWEVNELSYLRSNKEKFNIEFGRFKQDCRKRALEVAHSTVSSAQGGTISKDILSEADIYYSWLIDIYPPEVDLSAIDSIEGINQKQKDAIKKRFMETGIILWKNKI